MGLPRSWHSSPNSSPPLLPTALIPTVPASSVYQPTLIVPDCSSHCQHSMDVGLVQMPTVATLWPSNSRPHTTCQCTSACQCVWPMEPSRRELNHLINGDIATTHLHLNFLDEDLVFKKRTRSIIHCLSAVNSYDLEQPAAEPHMTHVRIVCDMIPHWHVDVHVPGTMLYPHCGDYRTPLPYLTVENVVHKVHASLHHQITQHEWDRLDWSRQNKVTCAYSHRCRSAGGEWSKCQEWAEGVKWVDFLLQTSWFKGFTWLDSEHGVERLGLLVGLESF